MADGYYDHHEQQQQYHVPQQSRRDKLRVVLNHHHSGGVLHPPLYDPQDLQTHNDNLMMMMTSTSTSTSNYGLMNPNYLDDDGVACITNNSNNQGRGRLSLSLCSHNSSLLLHEIKFDGDHASRTKTSPSSSCAVPLGPFTGYASILKGSRFLKPAQHLLEDFCDLGSISFHKFDASSSIIMDSDSMDADDFFCPAPAGHDARKSTLISMLHEVLRRYKQYYLQMQTVVASFETVAGLSNAAPYANSASKVMSKHFKCIKNAISEQLHHLSNKVHRKDEAPTTTVYAHTLGLTNDHQPVWRPQRGLPERAVSVLRAWLFEHFLHPYPTDTDKLMLAKQTGLSRNQVSNWFINARVRLWKPMVEEIHMLETRQAQKTSSADNSSRPSDPLTSDNPSTSSTQRFQEHNPFKRNRYEFTHPPMGSDEQVNVASFPNMPNHPNVVGTGGGVSLTLGLPQNNEIGISEPFHINAAQRFGLGPDVNSDGYVFGGYEATNRHFGRDGMVESQQLMHDFVG